MFYKLALLSLLATAASSRLSDQYGTGNTTPWNVKDFDELLAKEADAEGRYPLNGRNISKTYEETSRDPSPGWALTVFTKGGIPIPSNTSATFTGTRITLEVPDAKSVDPTWQLCVLEWRPDPESYPTALSEDDGTCSKVISEQCRLDIEKETMNKYRVSSGATACACPSVSKIASCDSADAKQVFSGGEGCQARTFNATQVRDWADGKFTVRQYGGIPQDRGNRTDYDRVGSIAWPVLVMWGQSSIQAAASSVEVRDSAQLACVRAKNATSASVLGAPNLKNGVGERRAPTVELMGLCLAVVLLGVFL